MKRENRTSTGHNDLHGTEVDTKTAPTDDRYFALEYNINPSFVFLLGFVTDMFKAACVYLFLKFFVRERPMLPDSIYFRAGHHLPWFCWFSW